VARSILIQILADASDLKRTFKDVGNDSEKLGSKLGSSFKKWGKLGAAGAAAGGAAILTKQLFDSVGAAKEAQKAELRLGQAFDSAKVKAKDRAKAQATVDKVSRRAALDDEDLSDVLAKLTRSTGSVQKGQKGMALAADIARGRNISLEAAAKAVEKAYLGQETGFKRIGVVVPKVTRSYDMLKTKVNILTDRYKNAKGALKDRLKAEIDNIKSQYASAKASDKAATAQAAIAKATKLYSGAAEKYGNSSVGAQEKLSVAFENLQERVGMKLLPILAKLAQWGVRFLDWSDKNWPRFSKAIQKVWTVAKPFIDNLIARIKDVVKIVDGVVKLIDAIAHGKWANAWKAFKQIVSAEVNLIYHTFLELPGKVVKALTGKAWAGLKTIGTSIKNAAMSGLSHIADGIVAILVGIVNKIIRLANSAIGKINKVSPFKDIPKIGELNAPGSTQRTSPQRVQPGTRSSGPRDSGDTSFTPSQRATQGVTHVTLNMDGREVGSVTLKHNQRTARGTVASRRGPHAGRGLALG
jgi:hypothetical protein